MEASSSQENDNITSPLRKQNMHIHLLHFQIYNFFHYTIYYIICYIYWTIKSCIYVVVSKENESEENSPIKQVALTVPTTDDPSLPVLTFRMWVLGTLSCVLLSFLNQFFWYRTEPLTITAISAQIAVVPLGQLMASKITKRVFFKGKSWEFTLNPGPFNVKEHVLITIFANSGAGTVYAIHIVTAVKVFYHQHITFCVSFLVIITTQVCYIPCWL